MSAGKVYLRPITAADTSKIVVWRNKDFVRGNFIYQKLFTAEGHMEWLRKQVEPGHVAQFIICVENGQRRGDGCSPGGIKTSTETGDREIGSVYLRDIDRERETAEYGIFIGEEDALGCGYGTEAARLALDYAFTRLKLHRVFLRFLADNIGAERSYEHAGFQLTDRRESVMTDQGKREVRFMETDEAMWRAHCSMEAGEPYSEGTTSFRKESE